MTPRAMAISLRIWAHCDPIGWDCTMAECADALGLKPGTVRNVATAKGWNTRFRGSSTEWRYGRFTSSTASSIKSQDAALSGEWL